MVSRFLFLIITFICCTDSYANQSRYDLRFVLKSKLLKGNIAFFQKVFTDDYLVKLEVKRVKSIASSRIKDLNHGHVQETKNVLVVNPVYLIPWPNDKNLMMKHIKYIEEEKRK